MQCGHMPIRRRYPLCRQRTGDQCGCV